jgi:hypothetical protein
MRRRGDRLNPWSSACDDCRTGDYITEEAMSRGKLIQTIHPSRRRPLRQAKPGKRKPGIKPWMTEDRKQKVGANRNSIMDPAPTDNIHLVVLYKKFSGTRRLVLGRIHRPANRARRLPQPSFQRRYIQSYAWTHALEFPLNVYVDYTPMVEVDVFERGE